MSVDWFGLIVFSVILFLTGMTYKFLLSNSKVGIVSFIALAVIAFWYAIIQY